MNIGKLDRRIRLLALATAQNAFGEWEKTYAPTASLFAQLKPIRATEKFLAGHHQIENDAIFIIRYRTAIDTTMRIDYGGKQYEIKGVQEIGGRKDLLEVTARAIA